MKRRRIMPTLTNRWGVLALLFVARASMAMQFQSVPPIAPHLIEEWGIGYTEVGLLIGLYMFAGIALALPGGLLGQRLGDKAVVLLGLTMMTAGTATFAGAPSYAVAFAGRLLGGVGVVLLNVQLTKIINDWFAGERIATAMGILMTAWPAGIALGLSTLGFVAEAAGWRMAIAATGAYSAAMLVLVALLYRDPQPARGEAAPEAARTPLWTISGPELSLILAAGLVWMLPNAALIVFLSFTPAFLIARGVPAALAALIVAVASWITIASIPAGGALTDRTGRVNAFIVCGVLICAAFSAALPLGGSPWMWVVLYGLAVGGWPGAIMSLPGKVLSVGSRSTGFGVFYTVYYVGMTVLVPVAGWLQDRTGEATASLLFGSVLMVTAVPALGVLRLLQHRRLAAEVAIREPAA
jgi:MFS family permease